MKSMFIPLLIGATSSSLVFADTPLVQPGSGYDSSIQRIAPQICYAAESQGTTPPANTVYSALSFSDLLTNMRYAYSNSNEYGSVEEAYMAPLQEDNKNLTYSTFYITYWDHSLSIFDGMDALNATGKSLYNPDPQAQSLFDKNCGDHVITSYSEGALFTGAMHIQFDTESDAGDYVNATRSTNNDLMSRANSLATIAQQDHLTGKVTIQAFQRGGDPSKIGALLPINSAGYYSISCDIQDMQSCINAAHAIYDYMTVTLPPQIDFHQNKGITPLGLGFVTALPKRYFGL